MTDHTDSIRVAARLKSSTMKLHALAGQVGSARQIREFIGDMKKNALSMEVVKSLKAGESAVAAEHMARASEPYQSRLAELAKQYEAAEKVIAEWGAEQASYEAARSLLSFSRETLRQI